MKIRFLLMSQFQKVFTGAALVVFCLITSVSVSNAQDQQQSNGGLPAEVREQFMTTGATAVNEYLLANGINLEQDSPEYRAFLYQILNDSYPDLLRDEQGNAVTYYAITQLGLQPDTETKEVDLSSSRSIYLPLIQSISKDSSVSDVEQFAQAAEINAYNRAAAVSYANSWIYQPSNTGKKRNSNFPNFVENDCTNFTSQVALAGGVSKTGDGACRNEANPSEWYVKKLSSLCGWPWQSYRDWAWSNSWSSVLDFRYFMRDYKSAYVEAYPANNESVSLLVSRVQPGDFVQLDTRVCYSNGSCDPWVAAHATVVVEMKNNGGFYQNDALYNDHSGGATNANDTYKRGLRNKYQQWVNEKVTNQRRMVWIQMR